MKSNFDCETCKGTGKATVLGYREMDQKIMDTTDTTNKFSFRKIVSVFPFKKIARVGAIIGAIIGSFILLTGIISKGCKFFSYYDNANGTVIVEVDRNSMTPIKCIVVHSSYEYSSSNNFERRMILSNRRDDQEVSERAELLGWEESEGHKCIRLHYSFDNKW